MILLLPLLRRFSVRTRTIIGVAVSAFAVLLLAVGAGADGHLIGSGVISAVTGLVFLVSALYDHRHVGRALKRGSRR